MTERISDAAPSVFEPIAPLSSVAPDEYVDGFARGFETERVDVGPFMADVRARGVCVAGAGLMGISIGALFVDAEIPVLAYDPVPEALAVAPERLKRELAALRRLRGERLDSPEKEASRVDASVARFYRTTDRLEELVERPVVVESIPEKIKLKSKFYRDLNRLASAPILALTNTSSLRVDELAASLPTDAESAPLSRARFSGFHFFHPARKRALLEIARGSSTSSETLARASELARALRKIPIVVRDAPGFLVNRVLQAYLNESLALLDEGVPAERIERVCRRFGMEGAPLRVIDEIGVDVSLRAGWSFLKAFPDRTHSSLVLPGLVREGRVGRKSALGFYRYGSTNSWADDAVLDCDRATVERLRDGAPLPTEPELDDEALALRVAASILFESARLIEEGVVRTEREVDAGLVLALGFPAEKGGIFYWARAFGVERIVRAAESWRSLGTRFEPPASLRALVERR